MLNSQLLNNLSDFFSAFKEMVALANTDKLDTVVAGLADARTALAQHAAAKADLDELADFKATKADQEAAIAAAQKAASDAAKFNAQRAKVISDADDVLASQKNDHAQNVKNLEAEKAAVKAREDAVAAAEEDIKTTKENADQALSDANALKQSYVNKLKTLAQTEGGTNGASGS